MVVHPAEIELRLGEAADGSEAEEVHGVLVVLAHLEVHDAEVVVGLDEALLATQAIPLDGLVDVGPARQALAVA